MQKIPMKPNTMTPKPRLNKKQRYVIEDIMNEFDFRTVGLIMDTLDWYWQSTRGVPSVSEIKSFAEGLLIECSQKEGKGRIGVGGFEVQYENTNEDYCMSLKFILEEWVSDSSEDY